MKNFILLAVFLVVVSLSSRANGQSCVYEVDIDYNGNDILSTPTYLSTVDQCCALCTSYSSCQAWTFVPLTGACWVKTNIGNKRLSSSGRYSGVRQATTTTTTVKTPTCVNVVSNINFPGYDLTGVGSILSAADCCTICINTPACNAFSYWANYQYCYLKTAYSSSQQDTYAGFTSGVVSR